jgi:AhpD family alkylhydroperoxidase
MHLELVATTVSHGNRCFYCTLGHLAMLEGVAENNGVVIDALGIADSTVDIRIEGAQELLALSRSTGTPALPLRAGSIETRRSNEWFSPASKLTASTGDGRSLPMVNPGPNG